MTLDAALLDLIRQLGTSASEDAYHRLLEIDTFSVSYLIDAYTLETNPRIQEALIEIIGEHRRLADVDFFGQVLRSPNPALWKAALDALVKINDVRCIQVLSAVKSEMQAKADSSDKLEWIEEGIQQIATVES